MKISELTEKIFVLNLPHRKDRLESFISEAVRLDFKFDLVQAVDGQTIDYNGHLRRGEAGLIVTYRSLIEHCIESKYESILVCEDDCRFSEDIEDRLDKEWNKVPQWDFVLIGANLRSLGAGNRPEEKVSDTVVRVYDAFCAHAVILKQKMFHPLLAELNKFDVPLDVMYTRLQKDYQAFSFDPPMAIQRESFSDILGYNVDYKSWGAF